jgi:hypothetical protein
MSDVRLLRRALARHTVLAYRPDASTHSTVGVDEAVHIAFETCHPIRTFSSHATQKHTPGLFWSATTGTHIPYESHLERAWLLEADYDRNVVGISTQPFTIDHLEADKCWRHTPDIFLRHVDGTGHVRDVKAEAMLNEPDVTLQAERTEALCGEIGWSYDMVGAPDKQRVRNLEWLAAYRRHHHADLGLTDQIVHLCRNPLTVEQVAAATRAPEAATAALFHLAWQQRITFNLRAPLTSGTLFTTREENSA